MHVEYCLRVKTHDRTRAILFDDECDVMNCIMDMNEDGFTEISLEYVEFESIEMSVGFSCFKTAREYIR